VANLTGMLQRFSLWEADWSTDDLHPLLERLEQLTAQAAAPPDTSALLEQFEARFADLSKRVSDYQLNARVIFVTLTAASKALTLVSTTATSARRPLTSDSTQLTNS
jgi:ABC-type hemin transport system substrate-binding protein